MKRGELRDLQFRLKERAGSEPYGHGPAVIASSDAYNASAIRTVLVAVTSSNLKLARAPGNVLLLADVGNGLREDGVINVSQILVVDKSRLVSSQRIQKFTVWDAHFGFRCPRLRLNCSRSFYTAFFCLKLAITQFVFSFPSL